MAEFKLPKTLAGCADLLYTTRQKRLEIQKEAEALEEQEKQLKNYLIETLPKSEALGVTGKVANVTIVNKREPQVEDWAVFYKYVKSKNAFHLMGKALNRVAIKEQIEAGKNVPGVGMMTVTIVSLKKA